LENVEYSIEPEKEMYDLSDSISLTHSFTLDSEKFCDYEYNISIYSPDPLSSTLYGHILVYDYSGKDVTNKQLNCSIEETKKITENFTLIPQKTGIYRVTISGRAFTRKDTGNNWYGAAQSFYLNIQ